MRTPASVYEASERKFPASVSGPDYPESMLVHTVRRRGHFRWKKYEVFLIEVLWGEQVGVGSTTAGSRSTLHNFLLHDLTASS